MCGHSDTPNILLWHKKLTVTWIVQHFFFFVRVSPALRCKPILLCKVPFAHTLQTRPIAHVLNFPTIVFLNEPNHHRMKKCLHSAESFSPLPASTIKIFSTARTWRQWQDDHPQVKLLAQAGFDFDKTFHIKFLHHGHAYAGKISFQLLFGFSRDRQFLMPG